MAHILIVEDEQTLAGLIRDQFIAAGHSVAVAEDGPWRCACWRRARLT